VDQSLAKELLKTSNQSEIVGACEGAMEAIKDNNQQRQREATAYHEAGHAVAFFAFKHEFKSVSIIPGEGFNGILHGSGLPETLNIDEPSPEEEQLVREKIIISLAGPASEHRFTGCENWSGSRRDFFKASTYAPILGRRPKEFLEPAREFVSSNWTKIEAVARSLLERQTLSAQQVQEICESVSD